MKGLESMTITFFLTLVASVLISSSIYYHFERFVSMYFRNAIYICKFNAFTLISVLFQTGFNMSIFIIVFFAREYIDIMYLVLLGIVMCMISYAVLREKRKV